MKTNLVIGNIVNCLVHDGTETIGKVVGVFDHGQTIVVVNKTGVETCNPLVVTKLATKEEIEFFERK